MKLRVLSVIVSVFFVCLTGACNKSSVDPQIKAHCEEMCPRECAKHFPGEDDFNRSARSSCVPSCISTCEATASARQK